MFLGDGMEGVNLRLVQSNSGTMKISMKGLICKSRIFFWKF